jgi:NAD(P)-dependent dehydrogenase (short-subunit alcohol dehydrogenase family)
MSTSQQSEGTSTSWDDLPTAIRTYLTAHQAQDADTVIATFTADAVVTDEGHTHHGRDEIRTWLSRAAGEYTFTTGFTGATGIGEAHVDVVQHLEGELHPWAQAHGDRVLVLPLDVTDERQVQKAVLTAEEHFGGIDVLATTPAAAGTDRSRAWTTPTCAGCSS